MKNKIVAIILISIFSLGCKKRPKADENMVERTVWNKKEAADWYEKQPWLVGANFIPSTAINQLEMWQEDTFDQGKIDQELGYASAIGMNVMRVYLHDIPHRDNVKSFYQKIEQYLNTADKYGIKTLFVLFDSCWNPFPESGKQPVPKPFVHNSGWVQSPGQKVFLDKNQIPRLQKYVTETISLFKNDKRILGWDVWNEPDNMTGPSYEKVEIANKEQLVHGLLKQVFEWARSANPSQPLTSGVWAGDWSENKMKPIVKLQLDQSDVISFHCYDKPTDFQNRIKTLQRYEKPLLCTEYMARPNGSTFQGFLPIAKKYKVAMMNWGLVDGKTQTKFPWDSWTKSYTTEPKVWFHDVFYNDGTPYLKAETDFVKKITTDISQ